MSKASDMLDAVAQSLNGAGMPMTVDYRQRHMEFCGTQFPFQFNARQTMVYIAGRRFMSRSRAPVQDMVEHLIRELPKRLAIKDAAARREHFAKAARELARVPEDARGMFEYTVTRGNGEPTSVRLLPNSDGIRVSVLCKNVEYAAMLLDMLQEMDV